MLRHAQQISVTRTHTLLVNYTVISVYDEQNAPLVLTQELSTAELTISNMEAAVIDSVPASSTAADGDTSTSAHSLDADGDVTMQTGVETSPHAPTNSGQKRRSLPPRPDRSKHDAVKTMYRVLQMKYSDLLAVSPATTVLSCRIFSDAIVRVAGPHEAVARIRAGEKQGGQATSRGEVCCFRPY